MMIDLKAKPFYLDEKAIQWVEETIDSMTIEEKIGQLFINLDRSHDEEDLTRIIKTYHIGGCRYISRSAADVLKQNQFYQSQSRIPLLIACNCDNGGSGACSDGTHIATAAACGASSDTETSLHVGRVSGREGTAVGCNWTFGPVCDILLNWRNTIVNTRAYGDNADIVIEQACAYMDGVSESNMASCAKHFPGDGVEELDQHLVTGVNTLTPDQWDASFGKVYQAVIDKGVQSIMVGHIALPEYSRKLRPGIKDRDIMPATLAPELLQDLLRGKLNFNGLILTDASHMAGMTSAKPRKDQVPGAIAAGCDMFLYFNDHEEDFHYMMDGYRTGVITEERLNDALHRILGLKASLGLHLITKNNEKPADSLLQTVGCTEHLEYAREAAERTITLVKDTEKNLPITPQTHPRVRIYVVSTPPITRDGNPDPVRSVIQEEFERAGFQADIHDSYYDLEMKGHREANKDLAIDCGSVEEFKKKYNAAFIFINIKGYAQENNVRLSWSIGHSNEIPWFVREVPTVAVSLNYTNHLNDLPMMRTFINAYAPTREVIHSLVKKVMGEEEFEGTAPDLVFCDRWDTRL